MYVKMSSKFPSTESVFRKTGDLIFVIFCLGLGPPLALGGPSRGHVHPAQGASLGHSCVLSSAPVHRNTSLQPEHTPSLCPHCPELVEG